MSAGHLSYEEGEAAVKAAVATFPETFTLGGQWAGGTFRVAGPFCSFYSRETGVQLVVQVLVEPGDHLTRSGYQPGQWVDAFRDEPEAIRARIVPPDYPALDRAKRRQLAREAQAAPQVAPEPRQAPSAELTLQQVDRALTRQLLGHATRDETLAAIQAAVAAWTDPDSEWVAPCPSAECECAECVAYTTGQAEPEPEPEPQAAPPSILTRPAARAWLRSLGQQRLRLPGKLDRPVEVLAPDGALWQVDALITGAFRVRLAAAGGGR